MSSLYKITILYVFGMNMKSQHILVSHVDYERNGNVKFTDE